MIDQDGDPTAAPFDLRPPSALFPTLWPALQASGAIVDMKATADSVPLAPPEEIERRFAEERPPDAAGLRAFVARWFRLPEAEPAPATPPGVTLSEHIDALWDHLTRRPEEANAGGSLIPLDHPHLVPGGMFREGYYWDSYFTLIGLGESRAALRRSCVDALAEQIDRFGFVPNGARTYYLSRSQPPTFFASVATLTPGVPERAWARYLPQLLREHSYWMTQCAVSLPDGAMLNRYWDALTIPRDECTAGRDLAIAAASGREPGDVFRNIRAACASGWDFSSRWLVDPHRIETIRTMSIIPVDLNALMFGLERAIARGAASSGATDTAAAFDAHARARLAAMRRWLWNPTLGAFDDLDLETLAPRGAVTAAAAVPLFTGCASPDEARSTAALIERRLLAPGGLLATTHTTGEQWDAPNGWAPCNWMAIIGLIDYGFGELAEDVAHRWLTTVARVFAATGKLVEKYDIVVANVGGGGEYPLQDGFGWTNGVTAALLRRFPGLAHFGETRFGATPPA